MLGLGLGIPRMGNIQDVEIGDIYQGGIVFYLDGSGGGLIAALADETADQWGCFNVAISGADGTAIGTGAQNTIDINAGCATANTAADRCRDKTTGGYTDWFLPSKDELHEMYDNIGIIEAAGDDFASAYYWTSSEKAAGTAWREAMNTGYQNQNGHKATSYRSRAIRAF